VIFAWAVVGDAYRPANLALLSHLSDPGQRKSAFALNRLALNLGMSVGPAVGGFLASRSYEALFWVDGITSVLAGLVAVVFLGAALPSSEGGKVQGSAPAPASALRDGRFLTFMALLLPVGLVFFQLSGALPLFLVRDLKLGEAAFGVLFTVNTLLIVLLEIPLSGATARWPHRVSLPLGSALVGLGFAATALATGFWTAAASVIVWTFGEMVLFPSCNAAVSDLAPQARRGEYMGFYSATFSLALAAGPYLGTTVLTAMGPTVLWGACGVLGLLSAAGMAWLWRRQTSIGVSE
jgi:MFS family permease